MMLLSCAGEQVHVNSSSPCLLLCSLSFLSLEGGKLNILLFVGDFGHYITTYKWQLTNPTLTHKQQRSSHCRKNVLNLTIFEINGHFNNFSSIAPTSMVILPIFSWINSIYFHTWRSVSSLFRFTDRNTEMYKRWMGLRWFSGYRTHALEPWFPIRKKGTEIALSKLCHLNIVWNECGQQM